MIYFRKESKIDIKYLSLKFYNYFLYIKMLKNLVKKVRKKICLF